MSQNVVTCRKMSQIVVKCRNSRPLPAVPFWISPSKEKNPLLFFGVSLAFFFKKARVGGAKSLVGWIACDLGTCKLHSFPGLSEAQREQTILSSAWTLGGKTEHTILRFWGVFVGFFRDQPWKQGQGQAFLLLTRCSSERKKNSENNM